MFYKKKILNLKKLKFKNYKNWLEAAQFENKIKHLEKNKIDIDSLFSYKRKHKEFIKNNKLILKAHQRFESERDNFFINEIDKIDLSSNNDKRM